MGSDGSWSTPPVVSLVAGAQNGTLPADATTTTVFGVGAAAATSRVPQHRHAHRWPPRPRRSTVATPALERVPGVLRQQAARDGDVRSDRSPLVRRLQQRRQPRLGADQNGRPSAPDDLTLGHATQVWLATSVEPSALASGGYWFHKARQPPAQPVNDHGYRRNGSGQPSAGGLAASAGYGRCVREVSSIATSINLRFSACDCLVSSRNASSAEQRMEAMMIPLACPI